MADITQPWPTDPSFETVNFRVNTPTLTSETAAGKIRRVGFGHSFYTFEVKYPMLTPIQAGKINGFAAVAAGPLNSFQIVLPEISYTKSNDGATANSTATVSSTIAYGATFVMLNNCGNTKNILRAGDYFKFQSHDKVYMAVADVTSNAAGYANVQFAGHAVTGVSSTTRVQLDAVPFTAILTDPVQEYAVGYGGMTQMSLSMREVW